MPCGRVDDHPLSRPSSSFVCAASSRWSSWSIPRNMATPAYAMLLRTEFRTSGCVLFVDLAAGSCAEALIPRHQREECGLMNLSKV